MLLAGGGGKDRMRPPNVELTCTHEVCWVLYSVPPEGLPLVRGMTCPTCGIGVLELREIVVAQSSYQSNRSLRQAPEPT